MASLWSGVPFVACTQTAHPHPTPTCPHGQFSQHVPGSRWGLGILNGCLQRSWKFGALRETTLTSLLLKHFHQSQLKLPSRGKPTNTFRTPWQLSLCLPTSFLPSPPLPICPLPPPPPFPPSFLLTPSFFFPPAFSPLISFLCGSNTPRGQSSFFFLPG